MASAVARFPLRDNKRDQHLALTYRHPRAPDAVPLQSSRLLLLPQEILLVILLQLVSSGSGASGFTLAALHSLALLSRTCFYMSCAVRALRLPIDATDGKIKRTNPEWCQVDKALFQNSKQIVFSRAEPQGGKVVTATMHIIRDCIEDRSGNDCLDGMFGAPRIFLNIAEDLYVKDTFHVVELSLSDGLKYFNTSCNESELPQGLDGSLWALIMDDEYDNLINSHTEVFIHSPHKFKRHSYDKWSISIQTESDHMAGLHIRRLEINDTDFEFLKGFFNSKLAPNVARCRFGKGAGSALLPVHVSSGGDVSPQNVIDDGHRRSSAARADRTASRVCNQLIALTRSGRIMPNGALAHEFETIEDAQNRDGYVDDQIARGDEDEEEESEEEDSEYVSGQTDDDDEDDDEDEEEESEESSDDEESSSED
jgi:hypothetical protein